VLRRALREASRLHPHPDGAAREIPRGKDPFESIDDPYALLDKLTSPDAALHVEIDGSPHGYAPSLSVYYAPNDEPAQLKLVRDPG